MTDQLRYRIAAALTASAAIRGLPRQGFDMRFMADAVIRELGLREERDWDALQRFGESSPYRIVNRIRYVTEWKPTND